MRDERQDDVRSVGRSRRRNLIRATLGFWLALAAVAVAPEQVAAGSGSPALRFVTVSGYRLTVAGTGWPRRARLILALHAGPWVQGLQIRTSRTGAFRVGVNNVDLCGGVTFQARDFAGHHITLRGPALACPSPLAPPVPTLTVLQGKRMQPREVRVLGPSAPRSVTLHVGERLHLWEPGTDRPAFTARADQKYLSLVGQGKTPARACPQVDCDLGFYWDWIGIRAGHTGIDLSPACRQSRPPCGAPDFLIDVVILAGVDSTHSLD